MKRRDLLTGLAASLALEPQTGEAEAAEVDHAASLYIPKPHLVDDRKLLHDFMDRYAFVDLVTATPSIRITHIPSVTNRDKGKFGTIFGHISAQNAQKECFDAKTPAVIVFRGPHGYISPSWYANQKAVPTWNFGVVHASGKLKPITDKDALHDLLATLIDKFEKYEKSTYDFAKLPKDYVYGMLGGIIGFEMEIELLEGKFKLGQERSEVDRQTVLKHLEATKPESIHDLTANFYEHFPKKA